MSIIRQTDVFLVFDKEAVIKRLKYETLRNISVLYLGLTDREALSWTENLLLSIICLSVLIYSVQNLLGSLINVTVML